MKGLIYQSFQKEFINNHPDFLELSFAYLLKCYYFPKYFRPEYWQEATKNFPDSYNEKINHYFSYYNDYCYKGIVSSEFIKGVVEFMSVKEGKLNEITDKQIEELKKAWDLIPLNWKEKKPWYPLSYCDLALDDCLIMVKWSDKAEIKKEYLEKLIDYTDDYDFPAIKQIGIYFAKQGKLLTTSLSKCPHSLTINDFQEKKAQIYRAGQGIFLETKY